jgi:hypothetical protein
VALARDPNQIGVVFVHGIGSQKPRDPCRGPRPARLITAWQATTWGAAAERSHANRQRGFLRRLAAIRGRGRRPTASTPQRWHTTEAWWSAKQPAVRRRYVPVAGAARRCPPDPRTSGLSEGSALQAVDAVFLPLFLIPATVIIIGIYILFRLMRAIPEADPGVAALAAIEFFLVDWFGDVRVLPIDRAQAANIRARVAEAIRLHRGRGTIVVIGHWAARSSAT